ncbi:MAG: PilW family protein [Porticoccaceae bacterium]
MLSKPYPARQRGISLIELMVGIAISLILLAGVITVMLRISTAGGESVQATRLNQQLRGSLDVMTKELQRAGYVNWFVSWENCSGNTVSGTTLIDANADGKADIRDFYICATPVINQFGTVTLWGFPTRGSAAGTPVISTEGGGCGAAGNCDCILYSYDLNGDGVQGIGSGTAGANQNTANFELFGFRWVRSAATNNIGTIQMRTGGSTHSCNSGTWQAITDDNVDITALSFALEYAVTAGSPGAWNHSTTFQYSFDGSPSSMQNNCTPAAAPGSPPVSGDVLCLWRRSVGIDIEANLAADPGVSLSLTNRVKIKNDHFNTAP